MTRRDPGTAGERPAGRSGQESGSALVMAIFVLVLLTGMGATLLFVTENEVKMSQVDLEAKKTFYVAEAGLEDGRETLRVINLVDPIVPNRNKLDDELVDAAGGNGTIDFDPANLAPVYDTDGAVTGFTGYGDDVPLRTLTGLAEGSYAAFLTNDAVDTPTNLDDTNDRVMITAIGTGRNRALEVVQAIVERESFPALPATITILGPNATFDGGSSNAKKYLGDDCAGTGIPGLSLPTVGVIGSASETNAEIGVRKPDNYTSGSETGVDTVDDIDGTIDALWQDCAYLLDLARTVRATADVVGDASTPLAQLGTPGAPRVIYIDGDYNVPGGFDGAGLLWVTGQLRFSGNAGWTGLIFTVGEGEFIRYGAGSGVISGANLVADIAGPDRVLFTADDCAGEDDVVGTGDDGAASGVYDNSGGGSGDTVYCSRDISSVEQTFPYAVVTFRQR